VTLAEQWAVRGGRWSLRAGVSLLQTYFEVLVFAWEYLVDKSMAAMAVEAAWYHDMNDWPFYEAAPCIHQHVSLLH
jgi:hypothetical protein